MEGPHTYGFGVETAQVVGGAATATGGYLYFTVARGWKMALGAATSFGGGVMFYRAGSAAVSLVFAEPMPNLAAGVAGTMTLGVIYALRKAAEKLDIGQLFGRKVS